MPARSPANAHDRRATIEASLELDVGWTVFFSLHTDGLM